MFPGLSFILAWFSDNNITLSSWLYYNLLLIAVLFIETSLKVGLPSINTYLKLHTKYPLLSSFENILTTEIA